MACSWTFPSGRGRPSVPGDVMASVIVLQSLHGLSDSETVDAVTFDLRSKAACGLPVAAAAFHATTLTTSRAGRTLHLHDHETLMRAARRQAETPDFQSVYRQHRPMVERSIAWLVRGNRRVRYRGVTNNDHWLHHRAAALNLRRLVTLGLAHNGITWALS
jgi:IS5 family transposase